jgi:hypothetical protein
MQKAYQALRVISEAQTIHIILTSQPEALMLTELITTCEGLLASGADGIKAVILDFVGQSGMPQEIPLDLLSRAREAVRAVPQPVLMVIRANLSHAASQLIEEGDCTLIAYEASLLLPLGAENATQEPGEQRVGGRSAERLGKATWATSGGNLNRKLESILDMLRAKSALTLQAAKASARLGQQTSISTLEALHQINQRYLENALQTTDAREGVQAFLEKRQPHWKNR